MSLPNKETVKCPRCGEPIEFTLWQSINTEMEFAIPDIISGKLFEIECKSCGLKTKVKYPILFNDMIHNVMIYYTLPENVEEASKSLEISRKLGGRLRIVTSQEELREKTAIFNAGYDDRIIELFKIFAFSQLEDQLEGKQVGEVLFHKDGDDLRLELVIDGSSSLVDVSEEGINYLEKEFHDALAERGDDDFIVDQQWAINLLNELGY